MRERYGVSGDAPVSVFHFRCANIDPRTYGSDILEQRNGMVGHDDLEKLLHTFYCIRRMHRYLCARRHPQQGRASSLCLDLVEAEVSSISLRNSLINANSY